MQKRDFIQQAMIRALPEPSHAAAVISRAEALWDILSQHKYGSAQSTGQRQSVDYVTQLPPGQQQWFNGFWKAFGRHGNKQNAAARWLQLAEQINESVAKHIIYAAAQDLTLQRPQGQQRKHAEGWLNERRWENVDHPDRKPNAPKSRPIAQAKPKQQAPREIPSDAVFQELRKAIKGASLKTQA